MDNRDEMDHEEINPEQEAYEAIAADIDNFDFARVQMLMGVIEKVPAVMPGATSLSSLAAAALKEMNEEAKELAAKRTEAYTKAEAERQRQETERQNRDEDGDGVTAEFDENDNDDTVGRNPRDVRNLVEPTHPDPTPGQPQRRPQDVEPVRGAAADATPEVGSTPVRRPL